MSAETDPHAEARLMKDTGCLERVEIGLNRTVMVHWHTYLPLPSFFGLEFLSSLIFTLWREAHHKTSPGVLAGPGGSH